MQGGRGGSGQVALREEGGQDAPVKRETSEGGGKIELVEMKRGDYVWMWGKLLGAAGLHRLIGAPCGSRLRAVIPMKSPFAAFCRLCSEFQ